MTDLELIQAIGQVLEAKIEPMRQDIRDLKEDVQALKGDVQTLKEDVQTLRGEVRELQQNYGMLEAKVDGVRVYIDADLCRTLNLLMEGQQAVLDRVTPPEKYEALEIRTSALEIAVRQHSSQIHELMYA